MTYKPSVSPISQTAPVAKAQNETISISGTTINAVYELGVGSAAIPNMTSYTAPSGTASASYEYSGRVAWNAFNSTNTGDNTTWGNNQSAYPTWIQYQFPAAQVIIAYSINCQNMSATSPTTWTFAGSNDGNSWTTLDTRTGVATFTATTTFDISGNTTSYSYYRLNVTAGPMWMGIQQLQFYGAGNYGLLIPSTDYSVVKTNYSGTQTLVITRLKAGTANMVVDYQ